MKHTLSMVLALMLSIYSFAQTWIKSQDAMHHKGKVVNVIGSVTTLSFVSDGKMPGAYMEIISANSKEPITLVVLQKHLPRFKDLSDNLLNNYVHVKGAVAIRNGKPFMLLSSTKQFSIVTEAPEIKTFEPL